MAGQSWRQLSDYVAFSGFGLLRQVPLVAQSGLMGYNGNAMEILPD